MDLETRARVFAALGDPNRLAIARELARSDRTSSELADLVRLPSNLLAHHLRILEEAGLLERRSSEGDRRRKYLVLRPVDLSFGSTLRHRRTVLFVCSRNSARSQFAAALWKARTGLPAESAGHEPASQVHPLAISVADEHGINLKSSSPKGFHQVRRQPDLVVTVCDIANEASIPFISERRHWSIADPVIAGRVGVFRSSFSRISARIDRLHDEFQAQKEE